MRGLLGNLRSWPTFDLFEQFTSGGGIKRPQKIKFFWGSLSRLRVLVSPPRQRFKYFIKLGLAMRSRFKKFQILICGVKEVGSHFKYGGFLLLMFWLMPKGAPTKRASLARRKRRRPGFSWQVKLLVFLILIC